MKKVVIILILLGIIFNVMLIKQIDKLSFIDICLLLGLSLIYVSLFRFAKIYSRIDVRNKELILERDRFERYLNKSNIIFLVLDQDGRVRFVNNKLCQLLGKELEEVIGRFWFKDFDKNKSKLRLLDKVVKGEVELPDYTEGILVDKNGNERIISWYINTLRGRLGNVEGTISSGIDITKSNLTKEELHSDKVYTKSIANISNHLNHSLELIFSALKTLGINDIIFIVINRNQEITFFNQGGFRDFGYSEKEVVGKSVHKFCQEDKAEAEKTIEDLFNGKEEAPEYVETKLLTKYGEIRTVSWHLARLRGNDGKVQGIFSSGIDITERKWLEEKLKNNKMQVEFFANLSHELRTPLNLIFSALQMQEMYNQKYLDIDNYDSISRYTRIMRRNIHRLLRLINNLVDITKIDADFYDFKLQNYNIVKLIENVVFSVKEYIGNCSREIYFESEISKRIITCDSDNLERVILNLLSNAIKFTDKGDKITVRVSEDDAYVYISVKDTGIGIKEEEQKMIFERFGQVDKSFTRKKEGSGIGLVIVKLLVEMHGGEISVESEYGEGSEFIIKLPNVVLGVEDIQFASQFAFKEELVDRIDIEFSDIYDL